MGSRYVGTLEMSGKGNGEGRLPELPSQTHQEEQGRGLFGEPEPGIPLSAVCFWVPLLQSLCSQVLKGERVEPSPPPAHSSCQSAVWKKDLKPPDNCGQLSPAPPPAPALPSSPLLSDRVLL